MDFATRAYNHSFRLDPIVRSLLDTDFYKLLMQQFIYERYPMVQVSWKVTNRSQKIRIADEVNIDDLRAQLDHVRTLEFKESELVWLAGQTFYGTKGIFKPSYIDMLRRYRAPEYVLEKNEETGQFELHFPGFWWETTLWEIYSLTIINELRTRAALCKLNRSQLDITYARAKVKLYKKLELLATVPDLNLTDFGTRRRHTFLWQEHCVLTALEVLGKERFTGTSNVYLAYKHNLEPKGTNAHELQMVFAALAMVESKGDPAKMREAQYEVLKQWKNMYGGNLLIMLPDTFGSTQFFEGAPNWLAGWKGGRPDSKEAIVAGEELIHFFKMNGVLPESIADEKLAIFADGLDVTIDGKANGTDIIEVHNYFAGKIQRGFGWGTNFTNDFIDCSPVNPEALHSISLVCKIESANGHPAVKLSDNYDKATGPADEVAIYQAIFGSKGMKNAPVFV